MAFPTNLNHVQIDGFPRSLLPKIQAAVDNREIKWVGDIFTSIDYCSSEFEWNGCLFEIEEIQETVVRIQLLEWMCDVG